MEGARIMSKGDMKQYLYSRFNGDIVYASSTPAVVLGGLKSSRVTIPLELSRIENATLKQALLEIGVKAPQERFLWRLKLNGVPVAREFKPSIVAELKNMYFSKVVYDVTPLFDAFRRRSRCNVTFKYESSSTITIEHVALLILYKSSDAVSHISFLSGALSIEPGESIEVFIKHPTGLNIPGLLKTVMIMPSTQAKALLKMNNHEPKIVGGIVGGEEAVLKLDKIEEMNTLLINHVESETRYFPKELLVSSVLLSQITYKEPRLVVEDIIVPNRISRGEKIKIIISNKGDAKPDKSLITLMHLGSSIYRKELPPLDPGEETIIEIPIKLPRGRYNLVARIIWRKLSRTVFTDTRFEVYVE